MIYPQFVTDVLGIFAIALMSKIKVLEKGNKQFTLKEKWPVESPDKD